jgi:ABC-type uncharacterized transport system involved in gliding motility auxiliary subunit
MSDADPAVPPAPTAPRDRRAVPVLSRVAALLLAVALVLGNVAIARAPARLDLTEEGLFTLDGATKKVLRELRDPAEIRVYWSESIPGNASAVRLRVQGLLDEYASRSGGRLTVTWVDMSPDGKGAEEAASLRDRRGQPMPEHQFQSLDQNQLAITKAYMGLSIRHLDQVEFVGPLADLDESGFTSRANLEYELTSTLWRMSQAKSQGVGLVKDAPGFSFASQGAGDRFAVLSAVLEEQYGDAAKTWITLEDPVPPEIQTLVVVAPKEWPEKKVFHLEQFLLRGGKVLLFLDPVQFQTMARGEPPAKSGLEAWLAAHGVEVSDGVLADFDSPGFAGVETPEGYAFAPYPYHLLLRSTHLSDAHPLTAPKGAAKLDRIPLFFPAEVRLDEEKQSAAGRKAVVLATTTDNAFLKPDTFGLQQIPRTPPNPTSRGRHPVMVAVEGRFESFWKGKPSPAAPPEEKPAESTGDAKPSDEGAEPEATKPSDETTKPADETTKPADEATKPAEETTKPTDDAAERPDDARPADETAPPSPPEAPPAEGARGPRGPEGEDPPAPPAMGDEDPAPVPGSPPPPPEAPAEPAAPPAGEPPPAAPAAEPPAPAPPVPPPSPPPTLPPPGPPRLDEGTGTLVVAGDAELLSDHYSGIPGRDRTGGVTQFRLKTTGFPFGMTAIDWALGNDELAGLRGRGSAGRALDEVETGTAKTVRLANYVVFPVLVVLTGILVWVVRRFRS